MKKAKAMIHPTRMKILQSLISEKELTAQQISKKHPELAVGSLYRHMNALLDAGLIQVVHENKIRGTIEKTYALKGEVQSDVNKEAKEMTREELGDLFLMFMTNLLRQFEDYLDSGNYNIEKDALCIKQTIVYLSDQECISLIKNISSCIGEVLENEPSSERKARTIATVMVPEANKTQKMK